MRYTIVECLALLVSASSALAADPSFQWFATFDPSSYSEISPPPPGTEWVPFSPTSGIPFVRMQSGVLQIIAPAGSSDVKGVISLRRYWAGTFHARIKVEEVRCGADFYFYAAVPGDIYQPRSSVGWYFSGLDNRADRMLFFTGNKKAWDICDGLHGRNPTPLPQCNNPASIDWSIEPGEDEDWYDAPADPRFSPWTVKDWHWYSLKWSGSELIPYVDGIRITTDYRGKKKILNRWVPKPDDDLIIGLNATPYWGSYGCPFPGVDTSVFVDQVLVGTNHNKFDAADAFYNQVWSLIYQGKMQTSTALLLGLVTEKDVDARGVYAFVGPAEKQVLCDHGFWAAGYCP